MRLFLRPCIIIWLSVILVSEDMLSSTFWMISEAVGLALNAKLMAINAASAVNPKYFILSI